jgi:hypothetical protein
MERPDRAEWSFVQALRHLVFTTDKWFTAPSGSSHFNGERGIGCVAG